MAIKPEEVPVEVFRGTGSFNGIVFVKKDGKIFAVDTTLSLTNDERKQFGNAKGQGMEALKRAGISLNDIPQVNLADIVASTGKPVNEGREMSMSEFESSFKQSGLVGSGKGNVIFTAGSGSAANLADANPGSDVQQIGTQPATDFISGEEIIAAEENRTPLATQPLGLKPPSSNLQPGDQGSEVEQLQRYLVANGFMTQAEMDTGPGIYGPRTTAAVERMQNSLGVDNSTGPGFYGPRTRASIQQATQTSGQPETFTTPSGAVVDAEGNLVQGPPENNLPDSDPSAGTPVSGSTAGSTGGTPDVTAPGQSGPEFTPPTNNSVLTSGTTNVDFTDLENSDEFKSLPDDFKQIVKAVFEGIATNDLKLAQRFQTALKTAQEINDPFFGSMIRLASDAIERGFVSIDRELEFKERQLQNNLEDLQRDVAARQEFLTLDEQNVLRGVQRQFEQNLETTRNNLAATGFTQSSRRARTEQILQDERSDIVESTNRRFAFERDQASNQLQRGQRDTALEVERLSELAQQGRLDLLRQAEETLGTSNLGDLPTLAGASPLGDVFGDIPRDRLQNTLSSATQFAF